MSRLARVRKSRKHVQYKRYNGFTIKINLFKYKRFKDRRCRYKNTSGNQLLLFSPKSGCFGIGTLGKIKLTISLEELILSAYYFTSHEYVYKVSRTLSDKNLVKHALAGGGGGSNSSLTRTWYSEQFLPNFK